MSFLQHWRGFQSPEILLRGIEYEISGLADAGFRLARSQTTLVI